ncbi:MAG: hypothetical protein LLF98_02535 [Clostridium sp.]|jgi:hypothetical protein|uniref:hypothetical protein n=1 Tax=Clostridium sp. TaxID=1506 RepID=UPI0025BE4320|nr:hypothetical protein [Clostridium sp.]MCE5220160.1 hypothetical protein [Clostridium sp.]
MKQQNVSYYSDKLQKLIRDAKNNNIHMEVRTNTIIFVDKNTGEIISLDLTNIR